MRTVSQAATSSEIPVLTDTEFLAVLQRYKSSNQMAALHLIDARVEHDAKDASASAAVRQAYTAAVAARLPRRIRSCDACFQLGPDSFALIQGGPLERNGSFVLAARLLALMSEPLTLASRRLLVMVRIGIAVSTAGIPTTSWPPHAAR